MPLDLTSLENTLHQLERVTQRAHDEAFMSAQDDLPRTRKELFRVAARDGLVRDPLIWFGFGDARNLTTHTYKEKARA